MDLLQKIDVLGESARFDICRGCGSHDSRVKDDLGRWIYPAVRPDGKRIDMLKILQSNVCEKDCAYCANRSDRDVHRMTFKPDELARGFSELLRRGRVQGLFLSSGVCGNVGQATERMLATVEILRRRYLFGGYIHLKILPGADDASIEAAVRMANRVSVNLEAPNARRIGALSKGKDFEQDLVMPLRKAHRIRQYIGRAVSMTTQFVVGAADESDSEILTTSTQLYGDLRLARAYYSAFQPISDTPWRTTLPRPHGASIASIRPIFCCGSMGSGCRRSSSNRMVTWPAKWIPSSSGRSIIPSSFLLRLT